MSDSYPTIQDSLSEIQKEFMGCVEMHLEPPDHEDATYAVEALYRCDDSTDLDLPGDSIRFALTVDENPDEDVTERRHTIEFIDESAGRTQGWIRHCMKRVEAQSGRYAWTESRFEVRAPDLPEGQAREEEVELEIEPLLEKIRSLDRTCSLVEV